MKLKIPICLLILTLWQAGELLAQQTKFEKSAGTETVTYQEGIEAYRALDNQYDELKLLEYGPTDSGEPLHLMVVSGDSDFDPAKLRKKAVVMVMNAIHPGEPDGVDASLMLVRDLMTDLTKRELLDEVVLVVIPFYNIGGALNRNSVSRANQNGPKEYGFRGNARNLDLNRDMVKAESKNAQSFQKMYREWDPDIFIDNHVSNGADYQYSVTVIATQENKLGYGLGEYLRKKMLPELTKEMKEKNFPLSPYVNVFGRPPDKGFDQFLETPRYSTGYAALFGSLAFVTETHMLKPYMERVEGTYAFMLTNMQYAKRHRVEIKLVREKFKSEVSTVAQLPLVWALDTTTWSELDFKGYEASTRKSAFTDNQRLYYDREKPFEKKVRFYDRYVVSKAVSKPYAYIIPQAWHDIVDRLQNNGVIMSQFGQDTLLKVEVSRIENFKTVEAPYEGHYLHYNTKVSTRSAKISVRRGDWFVVCNQVSNRFIVETLEPEATDSFFNWNFFDIILQQKEHFSAYVFEETAAKLLEKDSELKRKYRAYMRRHPQLEKDQAAQLEFIYIEAGMREPEYMRYPIFKVMGRL